MASLLAPARSSFSTCLNGSGGTSSRSFASVWLNPLALVLGQRGEVDRGEHLPDLHRRPAHVAELLHQLARQRRRALAGGGVGALGRAHHVCGARVPTQPADWPATRLPRRAQRRQARRRGLVGHALRLRGSGPGGPYGYPFRVIRAFGPGRVNLIGEHTDYNDGLCLPFAIEQGVTVTAELLDGDEVVAEALDVGEHRSRFPARRPGARERLARVRARRGRRAEGRRATRWPGGGR